LSKAAIFTVFCCLLTLSVFAFASEPNQPKPLLGDEGDGGLTTPIHIIPLLSQNAKGQKGPQIKADTKNPPPFSTRITCGECHNYDLIKKGWHFNAVDSNVPAGRPGEPWVYFDSKLCLQIPLSYRSWPGTYKPGQIGLTDFKFTTIFGRQMPGGGSGEITAAQGQDKLRQYISGKLEINCLICHEAHYGVNLGGVTGYSVQVSTNQNFRWAAAASSEFAEVTGSAAQMTEFFDPYVPDPDIKNPPTVAYKKDIYNSKGEVTFDVVRETPNERCYYCHSNLYETSDGKTQKWTQDADVHIAAGLKCVDCHRGGLEHNMIRGYPEETKVSKNPLVAKTTCEGCHLPKGNEIPEAGRFGAPVPKHPGIPSIHFDKLTCTACHSGSWPKEETIYTKTSMAHRLGTPNVNKEPDALPHILSPVLAKERAVMISTKPGKRSIIKSDRLAPHKILWPNFWAVADSNGIRPVEVSVVEKVVKPIFDKLDLKYTAGWPQLTKEMIRDAITALNKSVKGKAAYVSAGRLYSLDDSGELIEKEDAAAQPYLWPIAHNVRPAAQALGVRYCTDCHELRSPVFFGSVKVDTPVVGDANSTRFMIEYQNLNTFYTKSFAFSFIFRPWMKVICFLSSFIIAGVLLLYALRALLNIAKIFSKGN
jgi:hypothetical protein